MSEPSRYEGLTWDQIDRLEREEENAVAIDAERQYWLDQREDEFMDVTEAAHVIPLR